MTGESGTPVPLTVPFWRKPVSIFGLVRITTFTERDAVDEGVTSFASASKPDVKR